MTSDSPGLVERGTTAALRRPLGPPGRAAIFGGLWWRSWALTTAGGAVIGIAAGLVASVWDSGAGIDALLAGSVFGAFFGGGFGVVLGVFTGLMMGAAGAAWLVPYPGEESTSRVLRIVAVVAVGVGQLLLMLGVGASADLASLPFWAIAVASLAGAWWLSPRAGQWYIDRMQGAHVVEDRRPGAPTVLRSSGRRPSSTRP